MARLIAPYIQILTIGRTNASTSINTWARRTPVARLIALILFVTGTIGMQILCRVMKVINRGDTIWEILNEISFGGSIYIGVLAYSIFLLILFD